MLLANPALSADAKPAERVLNIRFIRTTGHLGSKHLSGVESDMASVRGDFGYATYRVKDAGGSDRVRDKPVADPMVGDVHTVARQEACKTVPVVVGRTLGEVEVASVAQDDGLLAVENLHDPSDRRIGLGGANRQKNQRCRKKNFSHCLVSFNACCAGRLGIGHSSASTAVTFNQPGFGQPQHPGIRMPHLRRFGVDGHQRLRPERGSDGDIRSIASTVLGPSSNERLAERLVAFRIWCSASAGRAMGQRVCGAAGTRGSSGTAAGVDLGTATKASRSSGGTAGWRRTRTSA